MAVWALMGRLSFANRNDRDRARTTITGEATLRGLTPAAVFGWASGWLDVGATDCTLSYVHPDEATINQANVDLNAWLMRNGRGGGGGEDNFGPAWVSDEDFTVWLARRALTPEG